MHPTLVLNVVGLTPTLLASGHMPELARLAAQNSLCSITPITPAVTCSMQATYMTGELPSQHGIVGNGWLFRETREIRLWHQSHDLIQGERVWQVAQQRHPEFTWANLFWWYNFYCGANWSVTPRPIYCADGRKLPDCASHPSALREVLTEQLGAFPLFHFWGPLANIVSSRWITQAALWVLKQHRPDLALVYLPHLDYNLQRLGPESPDIHGDLAAIDALCGELIDWASRQGYRSVVLSEYGIVPVARPVHINRALREAGLLAWRVEQGREVVDPGSCRAFALADHQLAHIYVTDAADLPLVQQVVSALAGVAQVLDVEAQRAIGLAHPRCGELVAIAAADAWFTWYYWLDDAKAPDFARTVDIHKKPGYDPVELFIDPALRFPQLQVGWKLLQRRLGRRALLDVIPLDAALVRGSHGRAERGANGPVGIFPAEIGLVESEVMATAVKGLILRSLFESGG